VLPRKLRPPLWQSLCATNHHVRVNAAVANSTNYPIVASLVSCLYGRIMCYSKRETSAGNTTSDVTVLAFGIAFLSISDCL
jgi:hypothetical protein